MAAMIACVAVHDASVARACNRTARDSSAGRDCSRVAAPLLRFEAGVMAHAIAAPRFADTDVIARGAASSPRGIRTIGPQFAIAVGLSTNTYVGLELAAGGLRDGPVMIRDGIDVTDSGLYVGFRAIAGARIARSRWAFAAELAPGVNDVSYKEPNDNQPRRRGDDGRFCEAATELDVRTRMDVRIARAVYVGLTLGSGLSHRDDVSAGLSLRFQSRPGG